MRFKTPCEEIIWNLLPSIRKEVAKIMVKEFNLSQREVAKKLCITESAVSQYLKEKRGKMKIDGKIKKTMKRFVKRNINKEFNVCKLCKLARKTIDIRCR